MNRIQKSSGENKKKMCQKGHHAVERLNYLVFHSDNYNHQYHVFCLFSVFYYSDIIVLFFVSLLGSVNKQTKK